MSVDLDRLRRQVMSNQEAERAATELEAARKVVERARFYLGPPDEEGWHFEDCTPDYVDEPAECVPGCPEPLLAEAIAAYDQAVQP